MIDEYASGSECDAYKVKAISVRPGTREFFEREFAAIVSVSV
jgi:hypothetical protein